MAGHRRAQDAERHGISAFGDLKYPADFPHFDYVDPKAPKGGSFSQIGPTRQFNQSFLTFNSLNSYILKGDAAQGMELTFATPDGARRRRAGRDVRPCRARACAFLADGLTYTLHRCARKRASTTARSSPRMMRRSRSTILKEKGHPIITQFMRDFDGAEATDDATLVVRFKEKRGRDVPLFVAALPIFSKRLLFGKRPFEESTLEIPLGSGPYKVGRFEAGRYIEYERVKDWWGAQSAGVASG